MLIEILLAVIIILVLAAIVINVIMGNKVDPNDIADLVQRDTNEAVKNMADVINSNQALVNQLISDKISALDKNINAQQENLRSTVSSSLMQQEERFKTFSVENEQRLDGIRKTVADSLSSIQNDNNKKLDEMRNVVDEKLQRSLEEKMNRSFSLVSERLEKVHKGLGEMQELAKGVGDLKKVLSNVKTRGIAGEIQLGAILNEIMSPEQYAENVAVKPGSREVVEFAVKLPGKENTVWLPIDSKFPGNTYSSLVDAYNEGDKAKIEICAKTLERTILSEAKDINTKYIEPPYTTEFAIMFLPFEGLYAEVVNRGLVERLQREYRVNIAGPSTMAAMLNSIQMGFKTLAIQKRSSEVWEVLSAVKTEFDKFEKILMDTHSRLESANNDLEKLVGTRTRAIKRKLREVSTLDESRTAEILDKEEDY